MIITNALECTPLRDGALGWQPRKQTGSASMYILISITLSQLFAYATGGLRAHKQLDNIINVPINVENRPLGRLCGKEFMNVQHTSTGYSKLIIRRLIAHVSFLISVQSNIAEQMHQRQFMCIVGCFCISRSCEK